MKCGMVSRYLRSALFSAVLLGLCVASHAATTTGQVSVSGAEQFSSSSGMWDSGAVSISVNGYIKTVSYGRYSTQDSIASAIAAQLSSDCSSPANARSAPGGVIYVQMRDGGVLSQLSLDTHSSISFNGTANINNLIPTTATATIASTQLMLGQSSSVIVQVSCNSACGKVDYRIDGAEWEQGVLDANGQFSATTSPSLSPGLHNVIVNYLGNSAYLMSSSNPVSFSISTSSTPTNPTTIYSYNISSYQANGNISAFTDQQNGTWSSIAYDNLNRLTSATQTINGTAQNMCWGYDSFGNRTSQTITAGLCTPPSPPPTYTNNQVPGLSYDASGDVWNDGTNQYLYDAEGRVCAVKYSVLTLPAMMQYIYDAEGERVAKGTISTWSCDTSSNGFTETAGYALGPNGEQVAEVDGQGNWTHTNVFAAGELLATYDPQGVHFHFSDWLGSRRIQTDFAGNPEAGYQNLPFGEMVPDNQTHLLGATEHHFTGKERDSESGLDYFGSRYYGSSMGRFMSPDDGSDQNPFNPQSWNLYSYGRNNPLIGTDPDGHVYYVCPAGISNCTSQNGTSIDDKTFEAEQKQDQANGVSFAHGTISDSSGVQGTYSHDPDIAGDPAANIAAMGNIGNQGMGAINWFATQMVVNAATDGLVGAAGAALEASPLATQIGRNALKGGAGEATAKAILRMRGYKIIGEQVSVMTSAGRRVVDFVVEKGGETLAIEVKTGDAVRSASQLAKDAAMESEGGRVGASGGALAGQTLKVKTIETRPF